MLIRDKRKIEGFQVYEIITFSSHHDIHRIQPIHIDWDAFRIHASFTRSEAYRDVLRFPRS